MYMPCAIAVYLSGVTPVAQLPSAWRELTLRRQRNVTMRPGVFMEQNLREQAKSDIAARWRDILQGYDRAKMADEAVGFIDSLTAGGEMNNEVLRQLYWMLIRFLSGSDWFGGSMDDILRDEEASSLCRNAMGSVEDLKKFILYIRDSCQEEDSGGYDQRLIDYVKQYVRDHIEEDMRVETLAQDIHIGADYLTRIFRKDMGCTVKNYIIQQKMLEAKRLLRSTNLPVSVVAAKLGYLNFSHFSSSYKKVLGYPPSEERKE